MCNIRKTVCKSNCNNNHKKSNVTRENMSSFSHVQVTCHNIFRKHKTKQLHKIPENSCFKKNALSFKCCFMFCHCAFNFFIFVLILFFVCMLVFILFYVLRQCIFGFCKCKISCLNYVKNLSVHGTCFNLQEWK